MKPDVTRYPYGAGVSAYDRELIIIDECFDTKMRTDQGPVVPIMGRVLIHELGHLLEAQGDEEAVIRDWENPIMYPIDGLIRTPSH